MRVNARRASAAFVAPLALATIVAGCTASPGPAVSPTASRPPATVVPEPQPTASEPNGPALDPEGDAEANLEYFTATLEPLVAGGARPTGGVVVDALTAAGFDRAAMQVTPDETAIGLPVDALLFSVRLGESCLLGQVDDEGLATTTAPVLASGACLVGATASLD